MPLQNGEPSGDMRYPAANSAGSSSSGASWGSRSLSTDWKNEILLSGGGGSGDPEDFIQPEGFSAALYINGQKAGETKLLLTEGGIRYD